MYCRRVCVVWICFFIINGLVALDSTQRSLAWWSLYNGLLSYVAIAPLFSLELLVRVRFMRRGLASTPSLHHLGLVVVGMLLPIATTWAVPHKTDTPTTSHHSTQPAISAEQLSAILTPSTPFRATFREQRHIAVLTAPLESRGDITVLPTRGVLWHTVSPIDQLIGITPRGLTEFATGTRTPHTTTPDRAHVSATMLSLMSGDLAEAQRHFDLVVSGTREGWVVRLSPKDSLVRDIITGITLRGSTHPSELEVVHASGDRIVTLFSPPTPLSSGEAQDAAETLSGAA